MESHSRPSFACGGLTENIAVRGPYGAAARRTGRIVKWYSVGHDRRSKTAEGELRRSEAHLTEAQKLSHTGSWVYDVRRDEYTPLVGEMYRIWRFDQEKAYLLLKRCEIVFITKIGPES